MRTAAADAERALLGSLDGSCHTPIGAYARLLPEGRMRLTGLVAAPDGSFVLKRHVECLRTDGARAGERAWRRTPRRQPAPAFSLDRSRAAAASASAGDSQTGFRPATSSARVPETAHERLHGLCPISRVWPRAASTATGLLSPCSAACSGSMRPIEESVAARPRRRRARPPRTLRAWRRANLLQTGPRPFRRNQKLCGRACPRCRHRRPGSRAMAIGRLYVLEGLDAGRPAARPETGRDSTVGRPGRAAVFERRNRTGARPLGRDLRRDRPMWRFGRRTRRHGGRRSRQFS